MLPRISFVFFFALAACKEKPAIEFISEPSTTTDHNREYQYIFEVKGNEDPLTFEAVMPGWLELDTANMMIHGIPGWDNVNKNFDVEIKANDGKHEASQKFTINVTLGEIICDQYIGNPDSSLYILPFRKGETYLLNQSYCSPNPSWGHHNYFAYDFEMPIGTELIAMRSGEVLYTQEIKEDNNADCGNNSGNYIYMKHTDGTVAVYYHLTKDGVLVNVGDHVEQGQLIGLSGNTGCSSGPHVHVNIFSPDSPFERQYTLPFNFRNAEGPLDANNGLILNEKYTAL